MVFTSGASVIGKVGEELEKELESKLENCITQVSCNHVFHDYYNIHFSYSKPLISSISCRYSFRNPPTVVLSVAARPSLVLAAHAAFHRAGHSRAYSGKGPVWHCDASIEIRAGMVSQPLPSNRISVRIRPRGGNFLVMHFPPLSNYNGKRSASSSGPLTLVGLATA